MPDPRPRDERLEGRGPASLAPAETAWQQASSEHPDDREERDGRWLTLMADRGFVVTRDGNTVTVEAPRPTGDQVAVVGPSIAVTPQLGEMLLDHSRVNRRIVTVVNELGAARRTEQEPPSC